MAYEVKGVVARSKGAPVTIETILVPDPGDRWFAATSALAEVVPLIAVHPGTRLRDADVSRLSARLPVPLRMATRDAGRQRARSVRIKLIQQHLPSIQSHKHTTTKQQPTNTQRTNALNLPVSVRKSFRGRFQRPRDRPEGKEVGN